jgi:S-DNA-T family DNA segregation ATPase FtsK/SpoIIIE
MIKIVMAKQRTGQQAGIPKVAAPNFLMKRLSEGCFILVLTVSLFIFLSLVTYRSTDPGWLRPAHPGAHIINAGGRVGAYVADGAYLLFGFLAYLLPILCVYLAWVVFIDYRKVRDVHQSVLVLRATGFLWVLSGGCGLLSLQLLNPSIAALPFTGGALGQLLASAFTHAVSRQGASLLLLGMFLVGVTWLTGLSWLTVIEWIGCYTWVFIRRVMSDILKLVSFCRRLYQKTMTYIKTREKKPKIKQLPDAAQSFKRQKHTPRLLPVIEPAAINNTAQSQEVEESTSSLKPPAPKEPRASKSQVAGSLPSLSLLEKGQPGKPMGGYSHQDLELLSRDVEQHLLDFGIQADVVAVHPGPVITRFELQLAAGIKASRLSALSKDLARSLSVISVRVVEIIPGKTVVGIELPNPNRAMVCLSEVLSSDVYQHAHSPLTLALGVDIAGHPMVVDLAKMPHLLVAGTTGSGKSVGINAMILSLLFKSTPEQVRLIMVDPKMLELSVYDGIPHLLTPVVTDMKEAASALRWCVAEMERRYRLMASLGVRNLAGFNTKVVEAAANGELLTDPLWKPIDSMDTEVPALQALPYIVVVIDELADMMMVVGKKVEQLIARIAQKARAAGIHLILATQRPSVDVLTGLIKSNIPTRISFQVSSKIDSRTILDQQGADQLLGHGDMLFLAPGTGAPLRVHGAFVDDQEVHRIASDWRLRGEPQYIEEITQLLSDAADGISGEDGQATEEADALYDQAVEFVMQTRKASISAVQRRFKIGYNRAARLIEEMERTGLVGPLEGGVRDVLVSSAFEERA